MKKPKLFIDLDDTVVDLTKRVIEIVNKELGLSLSTNIEYDWNWKETGVSEEYFNDVLRRKGIFIKSEPIESAKEVVDLITDLGWFDVYILTSPMLTPHCFMEKIEWVRKHFPQLSDNIIFTEHKHLLAKNKNCILLDDKLENCTKFYKCGGESFNISRTYEKSDWYDILDKLTALAKKV